MRSSKWLSMGTQEPLRLTRDNVYARNDKASRWMRGKTVYFCVVGKTRLTKITQQHINSDNRDTCIRVQKL